MSGRSSRARLLAPSFLVVASVACGGTMTGGPSDGAGNTGAGAGNTGAGAQSAGGTGYGGSGNPPVPIAGTDMGGSGYGGSANPPMPACPGTPPLDGGYCTWPQSCSYEATSGNGCPPASMTATCANGAWQLSHSASTCNPPGSVTGGAGGEAPVTFGGAGGAL